MLISYFLATEEIKPQLVRGVVLDLQHEGVGLMCVCQSTNAHSAPAGASGKLLEMENIHLSIQSWVHFVFVAVCV